MKKLIVLLAFFVAVPVLAAPDPQQARQVIEQTTEKMREVLLANRAELSRDTSKIKDYVREIMLPHYDADTVAKLVLGQHWRSASPEQRQRFTEEFRDLLINTYAKALLEYVDTKIDYLAVRPSNRANRVTVRTKVDPPDRPAVPIDYTMCHDGGGWKVCNLTIDKSFNFVVNYRKQIGSQVRSNGLDSVIDEISARNNQVSS